MKKQVKHIEGFGLTPTVKKHLLAVIEANNADYFGVKIKVTNIKMMVEKLENNQYKVTTFDSHLSMISAGKYETSSINIVEVK